MNNDYFDEDDEIELEEFIEEYIGEQPIDWEKNRIMDADIALALEDWKFINADPFQWATFKCDGNIEPARIVVEWGYLSRSDKTKQSAIQTIAYHMYSDGEVRRIRHTHS